MSDTLERTGCLECADGAEVECGSCGEVVTMVRRQPSGEASEGESDYEWDTREPLIDDFEDAVRAKARLGFRARHEQHQQADKAIEEARKPLWEALRNASPAAPAGEIEPNGHVVAFDIDEGVVSIECYGNMPYRTILVGSEVHLIRAEPDGRVPEAEHHASAEPIGEGPVDVQGVSGNAGPASSSPDTTQGPEPVEDLTDWMGCKGCGSVDEPCPDWCLKYESPNQGE